MIFCDDRWFILILPSRSDGCFLGTEFKSFFGLGLPVSKLGRTAVPSAKATLGMKNRPSLQGTLEPLAPELI